MACASLSKVILPLKFGIVGNHKLLHKAKYMSNGISSGYIESGKWKELDSRG
jgi:hypothetical protein